ncbi:MAG: hypothetical protein JNK21_16675, partial [Rhodospirillaceae bacterium]|nr:hypothetical protein [Rhodospirillaceae bacterium]
PLSKTAGFNALAFRAAMGIGAAAKALSPPQSKTPKRAQTPKRVKIKTKKRAKRRA